jgi:Helix-destabilising protein
MSIVRVKDDRIIERRVNIKGVPQIFREQRACVLLGGGYETTFNVGLGDGPCYQVGDYVIHPDSYGSGQYGDVTLKRIKLWPLAVALKETGAAVPQFVGASPKAA